MCNRCTDRHRTLRLLRALAAYTERPGADMEFASILGTGLACSLDLNPVHGGHCPPSPGKER